MKIRRYDNKTRISKGEKPQLNWKMHFPNSIPAEERLERPSPPLSLCEQVLVRGTLQGRKKEKGTKKAQKKAQKRANFFFFPSLKCHNNKFC